MALVNTVDPEQAEGVIGAVYGAFRQGSGVIPGPVKLLSASPGLFEVYTATFRYWRNHPHLSPDLMACIRYGVAAQQCFGACVDFNQSVLTKAGMTREELAAMEGDPGTAPLEDRERALLAFVLRAVKDPDAVTDEDVQALRELGWTDGDVVDATYHGAILVTMGTLVRAFKG